jgi:hypothetical protein
VAEHVCTARASCGREVAPTELTCPVCLGRTRRDLTAIVTLAALMPSEAEHRGVNSEAAYLAGPAADPVTWVTRKVYMARTLDVPLASLEDDDPWHPYGVLGRWQMMLEEDYGLRDTRKVTISGAASLLDRLLDRIANDPGQDFALFAGEIATCRAHLEAVLHDSRTPEKGAPCPECSTDFGSGPPLVKHYVDEDPTGASDHWTCPECDSRWSEADYRLRVGANYLASAAVLTADQMRDQYRIPPGTLRRWVAEGKVKRRGRDDHGRQMYDVADALMLRDVTAEVIP